MSKTLTGLKVPISINPIRTIIIDDEPYACERLKKLLAPFQKIQVIDYYTDAVQGFENILKQKPDLIFLDVELENNVSAFDIIEQLEGSPEHTHIILVTAYPHYAIKAVRHRVFDYLLKPVDIDELEDTLNRFFEHVSPQPALKYDIINVLSEREYEVLKQVLEGKNSREIAKQLFISVHTVNTHRRNILKKTGVRSAVDLLRIFNKPHE